MKIFSDRLRELRGSASQTEFAKKIGVSQVTYGRYELGTREPDLETVNHIGLVCGVSMDWLLGRETFGTRLKQSRENAELTVKEMAARLSVKEEYLLRLENGIDPPTEGLYHQCAKILGVTVEYLRDGKLMQGHALPSGPCPECAKMRAQIERLERIIDKLTK